MSRLLLALVLAACARPGPEGPVRTHVEDWRDHILYQVVVDRFANGDPSNDVVDGIGPEPDDLSRFQGGDWAGLRERLPYLESLGVTALWISPPYLNVPRTEREDGYHGYWPADFLTPNPRFGEVEDLRALVDEAHALGVLVVLDVVPNHAGRVFNYDLDQNGEVDVGEVEPPWSETPYDVPLIWQHRPRLAGPSGPFRLEAPDFHRHGAGNLAELRQKELADFPTGLRDLDTEDPRVVEALIETHARWVEMTDVDGFRIDAVPHAGRPFWAAFCSGLRERLAQLGKERFLLLGEVFDGDPAVLASYTELGQLDAAFAFDLKRSLVDEVLLGGGPPSSARAALEGNRLLFPASPQPGGIEVDPWRARVVFADNHDVPRIRAELDDPLAAEIVLTAVLTLDGIPAVYYGTEQGFDGGYHHAAREPLWVSGFGESHPTFQFLQTLTALRRGSLALRRGALIVRYASDSGGADDEPAEHAGLIAWERVYQSERLLVVINAAIQASSATFVTGFREGTVLRDALGRAEGGWSVGDRGRLEVTLPGRAAVVLRP